MIDIDSVRCFLRVVELDGFTAAAESVNLTQSAVTKQVQRLEEVAGSRLLTRRGRGVELTDAGRAFLPSALALDRTYSDAMVRLKEKPLTGVVRIGLPEDYASTTLPAVLADFGRMHPGVQLRIHVGLSAALSAQLEKGDFDLVLSKRPHLNQRAKIVDREPLEWVVAPRFAELVNRRPLPLALHPDLSVTADEIRGALRRAGVEAVVTVLSPSIAALRAGILAGLAVGAFGRRFVPAGLHSISASAAGLPALMPLEFGLELRQGELSAAVTALAAVVEDSAKSAVLLTP